ncbi:GyrI-like domain-containing protein [Rhizobium sp. L1K21]|uniref:AraC family transcriptional regulator n=1 Tax=Rhizobium sp. L1K21 TaxID=2954933 RepID=UPI002092404B|nr:AraC family transcriptional regulator [Rhizobium sp. L1K21]MCO6186362.1 AraC family transcriptional regulator [Rhizobium sp. L1K21]
MTEERDWARYQDRLSRVTDYIYAHLDEELNFEQLADVACLSPWHWHRVYRGVFGETVTSTVRRLRLHRAAGQLANTDLPVAEVAKRASYPNVQSFTRVFKAQLGMAPAAYRAGGSHTKFEQKFSIGDEKLYDVAFKKSGDIRLAGIAHQGDYMEVGKAFETLLGLVYSQNRFQPGMQMAGMYFDDPDIVPVDKLRSMACLTVPESFEVTAPLQETRLTAGLYAILTHKGPYADMPKAYRWFFGDWLATSEKELADKPSFELYLNNPREVAPSELLTEIWMPLEGE